MSVNFSVGNSVVYITVTGRLDSSERERFREINKLVDNGVRQIEVDMAQAEFLDSSALGMLLVLRDKLKGDKSAFRIRNAGNLVKQTLEMVKFDEVFELV